MMKSTVLCLVSWLAWCGPAQAADPGSLVRWQPWSTTLFAEAARQNKLVVLDLEALWCHWCHVMDQQTYHHPRVVELIENHYLAVRVDQDSNPELSRRYEDFGWPATIFFRPDGSEIIKLRGYIPPERMVTLLSFIAANPDDIRLPPEEVVVPNDSATLSVEHRESLANRIDALFDHEYAGWGDVHKFIHTHTMEYALLRAWQGSREHERMAKDTLHAARNLLDPVWGGVYQYSDQLDWKSPHFEKILSFQTDYIRMYALAFMLFGDREYLATAQSIYAYLRQFLMHPDGVFYTSQDADLSNKIDGRSFYGKSDRERRALGMPRIDKNVYARENGWAISALAALYAASGNDRYLSQAENVARWVLRNRATGTGGFYHGDDAKNVYLDDSAAMARGFLDLFSVSGKREWLRLAQQTGTYIARHFYDPTGDGYTTSPLARMEESVFDTPVKHLDTNIDTTRFAILLYRHTADGEAKRWAEQGLRYLTSPDIVARRGLLSGVLLADHEWLNEPVHVAIVGAKRDADAQALMRAAINYPGYGKRVDWWDRDEGPLPNPDIRYPKLSRPAAFACANGACSLPVFEPQALGSAIDRLHLPR